MILEFLKSKLFRKQVTCNSSIWKTYFIKFCVQRLRECCHFEIFYFKLPLGTLGKFSPNLWTQKYRFSLHSTWFLNLYSKVTFKWTDAREKLLKWIYLSEALGNILHYFNQSFAIATSFLAFLLDFLFTTFVHFLQFFAFFGFIFTFWIITGSVRTFPCVII